MPSGWVSGRQALSKSASAPGLICRVVIHTKCSSIVAPSGSVGRGHRHRSGAAACFSDYFLSPGGAIDAAPPLPQRGRVTPPAATRERARSGRCAHPVTLGSSVKLGMFVRDGCLRLWYGTAGGG